MRDALMMLMLDCDDVTVMGVVHAGRFLHDVRRLRCAVG
jgi:hypothetical protein